MYENALDWEHLPHVHAGSFPDITCEDSGPWGWRASIGSGARQMVIELRLDRSLRRWITRTLAGPNQGAEIWTHAFAVEPRRTDIVVDFFVPDVAPEAREKVGQGFTNLYEQLYDEDVAMMTERQRQLDRRIDSRPPADGLLALGARDALSLPMVVDFVGRPWVVRELGGELVAFAAACPHQLGPLHEAGVNSGVVRCPWHGYEFDVVSGACVSGQACRLSPAPEAVVDDAGEVFLRAPL
jgi:nitrite reductase/ring-hydroxylating ferredoxin subunit